MMMSKRLIICVLIVFTSIDTLYAQSDYYRSPLDIPTLFSGNFAEMRSNHFHSGLDFKTGGVEGALVRAVADGVVSRIGVVPNGFGKTLYIDHPNGTTSVYAHLQRFTPAIDAWVNAERYRLQSDRVDLTPPAGKFSFKKGELIGYSGNTGSSGGPHLHFEIRKSASQAPLNPITAGYISHTDNIAPTFGRLFYVQVDTVRGGVPVNAKPREIKPSATPVSLAGNGYLVVEAIDRKNGAANAYGIYRVVQRIDGEVTMEQRRDQFLFSQTRYINAVAHHALNRTTGMEMIRFNLLENNKIPIYTSSKDRGAIVLRDTLPHRIEIEVWDDSGNVTRRSFTARRGDFPAPQLPDNALIARHDRTFDHRTSQAGILIPVGALYEPIVYTQQGTKFHTPDIPLHAAATIWVSAQVPERLRSKAMLGRITASGSLASAGGTWNPASTTLPERITASVRDFGEYRVTFDTIAPKITPNFVKGSDLKGETGFSFGVTDDFSGIADYRLLIDGRWALLEHDIMKKRMTHPFASATFDATGRHTISLEVRDYAGNRAIYSGEYSIGQ